MMTPTLSKVSHFALVLLSLSLFACGDDDVDDMQMPTETSIASVAADDGRFNTLVSLLDDAGLVPTLSDQNQTFTVFAPTDDAFNAIDLSPLSAAQVRSTLLYHVFGGQAILSSEIGEGFTFLTTATDARGPNGSDLTLVVRKDGTTITANGAEVIVADVTTDNGVIHALNQVMTLPNVVTFATATPEFSELVANLQRAEGDLVNTLSGDGPWTVFAPTNSGFMGTATGDLTPAQLADVLLYHVINANVRAEDLPDGVMQRVATMSGDSVSVLRTGNDVQITGDNGVARNVVLANIQGTNGVVHGIDGVLLP